MGFFFYWWSLLGVEMYSIAYISQECETNFDPMINFSTFSASMITLFQVFTTSNWHDILYSLWNVSNDRPGYHVVSFIYLFSFFYIIVLWLTNLILALVWEIHVSIIDQEDQEELLQEKD